MFMNIIKYKYNREYKIGDNKGDNKGDNAAVKFEVYECTVGGI